MEMHFKSKLEARGTWRSHDKYRHEQWMQQFLRIGRGQMAIRIVSESLELPLHGL